MEVILTDAEQAAASWLDWDDEAVGKAVKAFGVFLAEEDFPNRTLCYHAAGLMMCTLANDVNSETTRLSINGVTRSGVPIGHFRITLERSNEPWPVDGPDAVYDGERLTSVSFIVEDGKVTPPTLREPDHASA